MDTQTLSKWINQQLRLGHSQAEILEYLRSYQFSEDQINQAFSFLNIPHKTQGPVPTSSTSSNIFTKKVRLSKLELGLALLLMFLIIAFILGTYFYLR